MIDLYKIGFYYHLPMNVRANEEVVICMTEEGFKFYLVDCKLIPNKWISSNTSYYDLSKPVLCRVDDNHVNEIHFLYDFPLCKMKDLSSGFSFVIDEEHTTTDLFFNKVAFIDSNIRDGKGNELAHLLSNYVATKKHISSLYAVANYLLPNCQANQKRKVINDFKKHIDSYDINNILSSLYVEVWDYYKNKISGDDSYYIFRNARLLDKSVKIDEYISEIIGLGENCIYKDSGYTSQLKRYAKDFLKKHPLGIYSGEILENEKKYILSLYSKEEHMAHLFFEQLSRQQDASQLITKWEKALKDLESNLKSGFFLEKLSSLNQTFFYDLCRYKDHTIVLASLNRYLQRIQSNLPVLKVVISGNTPVIDSRDKDGFDLTNSMSKNDSKYYRKIGQILEKLAEKHHVILVTGNANGAENLALHYASSNKIEIINEYTNWTMLGKIRDIKRFYEMAKMSDLIILTGDSDHYINKGFIRVAKELKKPIRIIKMN